MTHAVYGISYASSSMDWEVQNTIKHNVCGNLGGRSGRAEFVGTLIGRVTTRRRPPIGIGHGIGSKAGRGHPHVALGPVLRLFGVAAVVEGPQGALVERCTWTANWASGALVERCTWTAIGQADGAGNFSQRDGLES